MQSMKQAVRNYGIDFLRMFSMFSVVVLHVLGAGGVLDAVGMLSVSYDAVWFLEIIAYCAVNCYGLISGYVGVKSKFKYANILYLYLQVIFYTVLLTVGAGICLSGPVGKKDLIKAFFPFVTGYYWYFTAYFCIFFFMPFMNKLLYALDEKQAKGLVWTIVIIFSVLPTVFQKDIFTTTYGYSALWLAMLYLIGGSMRLFGWGENISKRKLALFFTVCISFTWFLMLLFDFIYQSLQKGIEGNSLIRYTLPTVLLAAAILVIFFARLKLNDGLKKIIAVFAPSAFGVYIIHGDPFVWDYFIKEKFAVYADYRPVWMLAAVLGTALLIYLLCSGIDMIRFWIFKLLKIKEICIRTEIYMKEVLSKKEKV